MSDFRQTWAEIQAIYASGEPERGANLMQVRLAPELRPAIKRALRRVAGGRCDESHREEVLQAVLFSLDRRMRDPGDTPLRNPAAFAQELVNRRAIDEARRVGRRANEVELDPERDAQRSAGQSAQLGNPFKARYRAELRLAIQACAETLDAEHREVFERWGEGQTLAEIAKAQELQSPAGAHHRLRVALITLRRCLARRGFVPGGDDD